ncbi:transposase [Desulfoglaeba alkanexedens]|nr:transposase [Desulfoglaeba alkanexedens]
MRYSKERKEAVLKKMMPPHNRSIIELAKEEGISEAALYLWRGQVRERGLLLDSDRAPEGWSARDKFNAVVESAAMNESELAEYCRRKGPYPEQLAPLAQELRDGRRLGPRSEPPAEKRAEGRSQAYPPGRT